MARRDAAITLDVRMGATLRHVLDVADLYKEIAECLEISDPRRDELVIRVDGMIDALEKDLQCGTRLT